MFQEAGLGLSDRCTTLGWCQDKVQKVSASNPVPCASSRWITTQSCSSKDTIVGGGEELVGPTNICCHLTPSYQPHAGYFNEPVPSSSAIRNLWFWLVPQEYQSPKVGWGTSLWLSDFGILCDHREVLGDSVEVHGGRSLLSFILLKRSFRYLDLEKGWLENTWPWVSLASCRPKFSFPSSKPAIMHQPDPSRFRIKLMFYHSARTGLKSCRPWFSSRSRQVWLLVQCVSQAKEWLSRDWMRLSPGSLPANILGICC
jgi:hypothetical protein